MKVVITCQPALGHFHPLVPLARALERAGHGVLFPTSAAFCPVVHEAGFAALAAGADWLESEPERAFPDLARHAEAWGEDEAEFLPTAFTRAAQALAPDLVRLARATRPDLFVSESIEWAGPLAAEVTGLPYAVYGIDAVRPRPVVAASVGRPWQFARLALGLPADPELASYCPFLYLDAFPPSLHPMRPHDSMPVLRGVRPRLYETGAQDPPPWLETLVPPVVYATMGTVVNRADRAFGLVLAALADEPLSAVVTVGSTREPAELGPQPAHIRVEQYVPQSLVLPHADVVVAHGGYSTMIGALLHGIPMLLLPAGTDQRYNAFAVERCGAGLQLDPRTATAEKVRAAIRTLLAEPLYRRNAERLRDELRELPPIESTVPLLEHLASERRKPSAAPLPA